MTKPRRITYANVASTLALVVALGGTSYAAIQLPKNSVGTKQLQKNAVTSKKVKDNTLTGKDVKESKLATVPSAANANALGGLALRGISQWVHVGTTGIIESQSGGITVTKLADPGRYRVTFASSVANCALNANGGTTNPASDASDFSDFMVLLGRSTTGPNDVQVETVTDDGVSANEPFWLTVQC